MLEKGPENAEIKARACCHCIAIASVAIGGRPLVVLPTDHGSSPVDKDVGWVSDQAVVGISKSGEYHHFKWLTEDKNFHLAGTDSASHFIGPLS